ncbi:MAG: L,D-transpeptidase family protein, partial [Betaproteobacteria bacterium]|nr:L,D-transpeptidase family protein [Betaproteobacteria bacterium]
MLHLLLVAVLTVVFPVAAEPFWGATASQPVDADPAALKPGQFIWDADAVPSGPIVVVVSLPEQRADIYRNGVRIGVATVSTGKTGHQTPTGIFTVLQKDADHHSKKYNNAPMPYSERLTWDGVALHAGGLPGYPSSHGCVHLPSEFARKLFQISPMGMTVVIANAQSAPVDVTHPAALSPVDAKTGRAVEVPPLSATEAFRWEPEKS